MLSKVWILPTVSSTVREAYFQVIQRSWKPCIWQLSKPLKMDYEHSELGTGLRRTQHYVWGTTPRITESICMMRRTFLTSALDMPEIMSYIIYSKSWKLQFSASSSIIIIEDYYLQTVLHSLEYWVLTIILDKTLYSSFCFLLNPKFCELHVGNKPQVHFLYHIFHLLFYWFSQKI